MSTLPVPLWVWGATIGVLVVLIGTDLALGFRRGAHEVGMREAALWTAGVVALAVIFGLSIAWLGHPVAAGQFFAGWLTEYSLSLDNLFIFVLLIGRSAVPKELHSRILLLGVVMALMLRGVFIALGASAISRFSWVLYLFGALLIYTAVRLVLTRRQVHTPGDGRVLKAVRRVVPMSDHADGGHLITRAGGRRMATPVLFLIIAIAATDLAFAFDSIPAIFGLTRDPYLIFTANAFALLGLRHLYFLVGGLLSRLVHLPIGLAVILGFIGVKLFTEALLESGVHQVGPIAVPHIGTAVSLAVIGGVLAVVTVTSLMAARRSAARRVPPSPPAPQTDPAPHAEPAPQTDPAPHAEPAPQTDPAPHAGPAPRADPAAEADAAREDRPVTTLRRECGRVARH